MYKAFVACSCSDNPATGNFRYPFWMVILVTPFMLIMAVVQAAIDRNKFIMNLIGAIVSLLSHAMHMACMHACLK